MISFDNSPAEGLDAIVVSFDLCGFSAFCNHPDAYATIPRFIARLFEQLDNVLMGGMDFEISSASAKAGRAPRPKFAKFTGDGAILIWLLPNTPPARATICKAVVVAMRKFQSGIPHWALNWAGEWQVHTLPDRARFGIACGRVYPLRPKPTLLIPEAPVDYVGYCINLAVRLQNHCPEVGFLVQEAIRPDLEEVVKLEAVGMKGVRKEPVLAFASDVEGLAPACFRKKFRR